MVIVTGEILARPETLEELIAVGQEHSRRSRAEPGCISHDLYIDSENGLRLFFFERWADRAALKAHFAVPESNDFMRAVRSLSAGGSKGPEILDVGGQSGDSLPISRPAPSATPVVGRNR